MRELVTTFILLLAAALLRPVSALALECDLTGACSSSNIHGTWHYQGSEQPTDSGQMSFMRMVTPIEQGYNTSFRSVWLDEITDPTHTHDLLVGCVPVVMHEAMPQRNFGLDLNKTARNSLLSQGQLAVFGANTGTRHFKHGSGSGDIWFVQVEALLAPFQYLYHLFYSSFGTYLPNNDRNEEWFGLSAIGHLPEPGGGAMLIAGLLGMCVVARRRIFSL
jgi:hypothetical protein